MKISLTGFADQITPGTEGSTIFQSYFKRTFSCRFVRIFLDSVRLIFFIDWPLNMVISHRIIESFYRWKTCFSPVSLLPYPI